VRRKIATVVYQQIAPVIQRNRADRLMVSLLLLLGLTVAVGACAPSANPPKETPAPSPTSS
jgi:hypothetical protein